MRMKTTTINSKYIEDYKKQPLKDLKPKKKTYFLIILYKKK